MELNYEQLRSLMGKAGDAIVNAQAMVEVQQRTIRAQAEEIEQMVPRRMVESLKQDLFRAQEEIKRLKAQGKPTEEMTDTRRLTPEVREQWKTLLSELPDHSIGAHEEFTINALHDLDVADAQIKSAALEIAERSAELAASQATIAQQQKLFGVFTPCPNCDGSGKDSRGSGCCRIPGHSTECACLVCQWMNGWYRLSRDNDELHAALDASQDRVAQLQEKCEKIPGYVAQASAHRTLLMERDAVIAAMREALEASVEIIELHTTEGDEIAQGVVVAARSALSNTAQLAADHDAAVRADERRKVLEEVKQMAELWAETEIDTVTHNAAMGVAEWAERQLTAQPE